MVGESIQLRTKANKKVLRYIQAQRRKVLKLYDEDKSDLNKSVNADIRSLKKHFQVMLII